MRCASPGKRIAIVGAGLGGLSAAIHLRLAGFEVTIFEALPLPGGRANLIEQDGFRFDTGPSLLNYPWVFEELFAAAGRRLGDQVTLLPVDPSIAFLWPDGTSFSLSSDLRRLKGECERLEPGVAPGLTAFLSDGEAKYNFSFRKLVRQNTDHPLTWFFALSPAEMMKSSIWRSLDSELSRFFKSRYLRQAFGSYAMYLGGSPKALPGLFSILSYAELAYGLWLPRGGIYSLVEAIARLAAEMGVPILTGRRVRRIIVHNRRVRGLEFDEGATEDWPMVVSNVDVPTTRRELLPPEYAQRPNNLLRRDPTMTPGVVTFYWGVRSPVEGLQHHTIFLPHDVHAALDELFHHQRIPEDPPFYVSIPSATDPTLAPPGHQTMFVLIPAPLPKERRAADWARVVPALKAKVLGRLHRHHVEVPPERLVMERIYTPEDWERWFGLYHGSAFAAAHTLFQVGPFRDRNFDRDIQGLYYTGAGTTPGTGLPMVILSGQMTAERICAHAC
ncbi:MAG: phytoene desaturase family protein [candidate division NC10 bacterium]|nr:phytoene desaturase family protein [candidate division NC10 bacterium]